MDEYVYLICADMPDGTMPCRTIPGPMKNARKVFERECQTPMAQAGAYLRLIFSYVASTHIIDVYTPGEPESRRLGR